MVVGTCASWDSIWAITAFRYEAPACQNVSITIPIVPELDALDALVVELQLIRMTGNLDVDAYFDNLALVDLPEPASAGAWGSLAVLAYLGHSRRAAR